MTDTDPAAADSATAVLGAPPSDTPGLAIAPPQRQRGERLGRYVIAGELGAGGMGVVYRARDPELDRDVALKVLLSHSRADPRGRERLLREAQAMARLSHQNVLPIFDVSTHDGQVFVAMELVEGQTLRTWLDAAARTRDEVLDVFVRAARGLAAAHHAGLVHRDFKPTNVMIGDDGRVRVMDFGLARAAGGTSDGSGSTTRAAGSSGAMADAAADPSGASDALATPLTRAGTVMGTPAYMAPEQHAGARTDGRCDQFSFCVSLHEALYGKRPFASRSLDWEVAAPPPDSNVPIAIRQVVLRGLSKHPDNRYPSMDALLDALRRARRRRLPSIWIGAGITAAAGVAFALTASPEDACAGAQSLQTRWNDTDRSSVAAAFEADASVLAQSTWPRVQARLDDYIERWTDARTATCEAAGETDSRDLDLRVACLDRARQAFASLVDVLSDADHEVIEHALSASARLPPLASCRDIERLRMAAPPPTDPKTAAAVEAIRTQLARARALDDAGKPREALATSEPLPAEAGALGYGPLVAEVGRVVGTQLEGTGRYDEAATTLEVAYHAAVGAQDADLAVETATALARLLADALARPDDAEVWARHARSRIPEASAQSEALVLGAEGMIAHARGDYETALAKQQSVLDSSRARLRPDDPELLLPLNLVASTLSELGRHEEAHQRIEELLALAESTFGPEHTQVGSALSNLATTDLLLGDYDGAIERAERARDVYIAAAGPDHPGLAQIHTTLADAYQALGRYDDALTEFETVLQIQERLLPADHPTVAEALSNVAYGLARVGRGTEAQPILRRAAAIIETSLGPEHPRLGTILHNLGNRLRADGQLAEAQATYARALEIREKGLGPDHDLVAAVHNDLGVLAMLRDEAEGAVVHFGRALEIVEGGLGPDHVHTATVLEGLADALLAQGDVDEGRAALRRAVRIWEKNPKAPQRFLAIARFSLAEALWRAPRDRDAARSVARAARDGFVAVQEEDAAQEVERWLADRGG